MRTTLQRSVLATLILLSIASFSTLKAQVKVYRSNTKTPVEVTMSGYAQAWVVGAQANAKASVGRNNESKQPFARMGLRRVMLKTIVNYGDWAFANELTENDRSIALYRATVTYQPKAVNGFSFTAGLAPVPFGYGCTVSSSKHETPERSMFASELFPSNVDMGLFVKYSKSLKSNYINHFSSDFALLSGNGIFGMRKSVPDVLLRVQLSHKKGQAEHTYSLSGYYGYATAPDLSKARRMYIGGYNDLKIPTAYGTLQVRTEVVGGVQAGTKNTPSATSFYSPESLGKEGYMVTERPFVTVSETLIYRLACIPLQGVIKYDFINHNLHLQKALKDDNQLSFKANGEVHQTTIGLNYFTFNDRVRLSAFYEWNVAQKGFNTSTNKPIWLPNNNRIIGVLQFIF